MKKRNQILLHAIGATLSVSAANASSFDIDVTIRDFKDSHPNFESVIAGVETGIVDSTLGGDGKPVFVGGGAASVTTAADFDQWYNDVPGTNMKTTKTLTFGETAPGSGIFEFSDSSFFPIDGELFGNEGNPHNYHFTLELNSSFTYLGGETFDFTGDDDLWLFIDDELVVDIGGVHGAASGSVDLDTLGLTVGDDYSFDLFFAERHTTASNFKVQTSIQLTSNVPDAGASFDYAMIAGLGLVGLTVARRRV